MAGLDYQGIMALSEGTVFITIDGKNVPLIEVKEATAEGEFNKEDIFALGKRAKGSKVTSISFSGSLTLFHVSSMWNDMVRTYLDSGYLPKMTMTATMEDKSANNGKQVVSISGFMPDKITIFSLEADDGIAENEMDFTFDDMIPIESLKEQNR